MTQSPTIELSRRKPKTQTPKLSRLEGGADAAAMGLVLPLSLNDVFEQVWVISLKRRKDRLSQFWLEIEKSNWPFKRPEVFYAIDGDKVGVPSYWQTGGGSYGCLRSHLNLIERAIQDDVQSLLIMEDDAVFAETFGKEAAKFLAKVPDSWECLMFGGQHVNSEPLPYADGVVRAGGGGGVQRTHCYALRGQKAMKALYTTWANAAVHCDWVMGPCMAKHNTFAPDPFLVGQGDGASDISGQNNPVKFWRSPSGNEPVVVLSAPRTVMDALRNKGWHAGFTRDANTGIDVGLRDIFTEPNLTLSEREEKLKDWINMIQWEVVSMPTPAFCTIWHPSVRAESVSSLIRGRVIEITAETVQDALRQLPVDIHTPVKLTIRAVLLRAPREVMEDLRNRGWHTGFWRDEVTGEDNGLRRLFASIPTKSGRSIGIQKIAKVLHDEVQKIPNGVVALWHDEITKDMVESEEIQVFEIDAVTAEAAVAQWSKKIHGG